MLHLWAARTFILKMYIYHGTNSLHYQFADSGIVSIRVGADVKSIWDGSFKGCTDLQSITVDAGNSIFFSKDGILMTKFTKPTVERL